MESVDMFKAFKFAASFKLCVNLFYRNLTVMKTRLKGAKKGHSLLKKKADALKMRFHLILNKIIEVCFTNI